MEPTSLSSSLAPAVAEAIEGKYEVKGVLGEGGTGIVYDARRVSDDTPVALKVMHPHLAGEKQIVGRFQREAAILRRLEGPHICPILEVGEATSADPGKPVLYIALAKLVGPTLEEVLATEAPLDLDRSLDIMLEVCAALRTAHAQGVIHRDLKPANVILHEGESEGGKRRKVVVVDFGMSKIVTGAGTGTTNLTAHNMVFGTPEYMSPEQARGDELDARCDVYAAGVMLYELLTGGPPFTGATPLGVLTEHLSGQIELPSKRAAAGRVSVALESVVMHALARDRDDRYPSASALAAAILHARARPDDVNSLRPEAFATSPAGTDAFAATIPAMGPPPGDSSSPRAVLISDEDIAAGATIPAADAAMSVKPAPKTSSPPLSRDPSSGGRRTRSIPTVESVRPKDDGKTTKGWIAVWVLATLASVAIGIWLALRK